MNRPRRAHERFKTIPESTIFRLSDGLYGPCEDAMPLFDGFDSEHLDRIIWLEIGEVVVADFAAEFPGKRPSAWWSFDAPEPRHRIGGRGDRSDGHLNITQHFEFGLPQSWIKPWHVEYFNGRSRDVDGERIGREFHEGDFTGVAVDPNDLPTFESQAAFLKRLDLLMPDEEARLTARDFEPEAITIEGIERDGND